MFSRFERRAMSFVLAGLVSVSGWQAGGLQAHAQDDDTATVQASLELVGEDSGANQDEGFFQIYEPEETPKVMDEASAGAESAGEMYPEEETSEASHVTETFQAEEELTDLGEITEGEWRTLIDDSYYYTFKPRKTGLYVLEGEYYWIDLKSTVSGEDVSCGGPVYRLEQGSTYSLRTTSFWRNFRIVAYEDLETITTGVCVSGQVNERFYRFTPDSDGIYVLDGDGELWSSAYCSSDATLDTENARFAKCEYSLDVAKGQACLIMVNRYEESLEIKKCTDKGEANAGVEYGGQGSGYAVYTLAPDTSGYYFVTGEIKGVTGDLDYSEELDVNDNDAWFIRTTESGQVRIIADEYVKLRITALDRAPEVTLNSGMKSYGAEVYQYTAEETGVYGLEMSSEDDAVIYKETGGQLKEGSSTVSLEKGERILILANGWHDSDSYLQWALKKKEKKGTLELGKVYSLSADEYYEFVPTEYVVCRSYGAFTVYDEDWERVGNYKSLNQGESCYVTSLRSGQGKLCDSNAAMTLMELGEKYIVFKGEVLCFTPAQTGFYALDMGDNVDWGRLDTPEWSLRLHDQPFYLKSGMECIVKLTSFYDDYMPAEIAFRKAEPEMLTVGERKVIDENTTGAGYVLTVPEEGDYAFSVDGLELCKLCDENRELETWYPEGKGEVLQWTMEGNKEYYVCVSSEKGVPGSIHVDKTNESGDYTYVAESDGTVRIIKYSGTEANVSIPDKLDGKAVSKIGMMSFSENETLQTVSFPAGVTEIQYGAFLDCSSLKKVEFRAGSTLKSVGGDAFGECGLKEVHIPSTVTEIGSRAFGYNYGWSPVEDFVIYGVEGSEAQKYAEENEITFVAEAVSMKGDLNGDQKVNLLDLRMVLRAICGKTTLTGEQEKVADINGDGAVNLLDLRLVLRFICGKISSL